MKRLLLYALLALVLTLCGCQPEQIDYDTSPLSFETVFDDTPGNPDKPDQPEDFAFHVSHHPPAYRVRTYDFEEDTICKGAFYILSPEDSYEIEELPPEKGIIKGVFTCDYTKQGNGLTFKNFNAHELLFTIKRALGYYADSVVWESLVRNAMESDYGWSRSAKAYADLYQRVLKK